MSIEFLVIPPRPLSSSDLSEIDLVTGLRQRFNTIPKVVVSPAPEIKKKRPLVLRVLKRLANWLNSKIPHGSHRRHIARKIVHKLPLILRQRLVTPINSPSSIVLGDRKKISYSLDQGFALPTSTNPLVTIVIPVFNNWWVKYVCLRALQSNNDSTPYEIIIVDDGSSDYTSEALDNIRGITVVRNLNNIGYLSSTNRGAAQTSSTSKYLVLLNNDTEPVNGWLDNLYKKIECDETIAIVGSALIYPDGTLQEAGGQIFSGGNAWNLGRGGNPLNGMFLFSREVDYCSAASVIVRKSFWVDVKGFDTQYLPAYCEDSDLALSAWKKGMKVMYEPKSWVIHHEGLSHGTDTDSGLKKHQITNNQKLIEKWESELRGHWGDFGVARYESKRESKGIVVVCDSQLPSLTRDAGSIRTVQIIKHIQALGYHVVLACLDNTTTQVDLDYLQSQGVEIHQNSEDFFETLSARKSRIVAIWTIRHEVYDFFSERLKEIAPNAIFIADLMDLKYKENYNIESGISENQTKIADQVERVILVSEVEAIRYNSQTKLNNAIVVWAEYEPQNKTLEWGNTSGLIFVGGFRHLPNLEGIQWFADHVVPELNRLKFTAPVRVVGSGLSVQKKAELQSKGIEILGSQEDIEGIYMQSRIAIVPLLSGAGRKGKVGEALAYGIPIVSTSIGVDGFHNLENAGIAVADSPAEMAEAIYALHEQHEVWKNAAVLGKAYCASNLSSMAMRNEISKLISLESGSHEEKN
jgi:GT2 family glycosyltransferase/glycosyltransferase involved in cell wall biosynthesis